MTHRPGDEELGPGDPEAALETRRELGDHYDAELVAGFADRIERTVELRVAEGREIEKRRTEALAAAGGRQLALGIVSLVAFIPISIVLGVNEQFLALLVTVAGIVAVNWAHAVQGRR